MTSRFPSGSPDQSAPDEKKSGSRKKFRSKIEELRAASLGWNFATAPLVGGALGYGIDWLAGTYPWGMLIGVVLGFVSAFIEVLRSSR